MLKSTKTSGAFALGRIAASLAAALLLIAAAPASATIVSGLSITTGAWAIGARWVGDVAQLARTRASVAIKIFFIGNQDLRWLIWIKL